MSDYEQENSETYYTRLEAAEKLEVSLMTIYHYWKQGKIRKVSDPHRLFRENRYYASEIDDLVLKKRMAKVDGYTTSQLKKMLGVTQQKIYQLIKENNLKVHEVPYGDERIRYIIPKETMEWMKEEIQRTAPTRGLRSEFYDSNLNVALYQQFISPDNHFKTRISKNDNGEWGFYLSSRTWIPYSKAVNELDYKPTYKIHRSSLKINGYTDFVLPKENELSFVFLDYLYQRRGIENIRLREYENHLDLSVKSGAIQITEEFPSILTKDLIKSFLLGGAGDIIFKEEEWIYVSGYQKTSMDLPITAYEKLHEIAGENQITFNELMEKMVEEYLLKVRSR